MIEEILSLKDQVTGPAQTMMGSLTELESSLAGAMTGFAGAGESAGGMGSAIDTLVPGLGIAIGVIGALTAALGGLVLAGASAALEQADFKAKTLAAFSALGGGPEAGKATFAMLDDLSSKLPQSRSQIAEWTKQFQAMGVTDVGKLRDQVTAVASATALMGEEGASAYTSISRKVQEAILAHQGLKIADLQLQKLAKTGVNVADIAAQMGVSTNQLRAQLQSGSVDASKFGDAMQRAIAEKGAGALDQASLSMGTQLAKLKENLGRLFEDVDASPFLGAMRDLLGIFDQAKPSGQALKFLVTGFFNGLFSIASKVFPYIRKFFLELVIVGLKFYIALKPTIAAFKALFATKGDGDGLMSVVLGIADAFGLVLQGVASAVGWFTQMLTLGKAVVGALSDAFSGVASIAENLISGLINGITGGIGKVVDAAKNLAKGAMDAIKGTLGIHSPSKIMLQMGAHTATGFAQGMSQDTGVAKAAAGMAGDAIPSNAYAGSKPGAAPATSAGGGAGGGGGNTFNVQVEIAGAGKSAMEITKEMVAIVFEEIALTQGYGGST